MAKQTLHYVHPTGLALGITSALLYTICAAAIKLWPTLTVGFFNSWFHGIDLMSIFNPVKLTWITFFKGLVSIVVAAYITGALYGWIYNKCVAHCKRKGWL